jgi:hypothetical protein
MRLVILESPFAGPDPATIKRNVQYARACMRDCLLRGEAPFASHLLYTQPGVLRDGDASERALGMKAGLAFSTTVAAHVVYTDLGITPGMRAGMTRGTSNGRAVEERQISPGALDAVMRGEVPYIDAIEDEELSPRLLQSLLLAAGVDLAIAVILEHVTDEETLFATAVYARAACAVAQGKSSVTPIAPPWLKPFLTHQGRA